MKRALVSALFLVAVSCTAFAADPSMVLTPDSLGSAKVDMPTKRLQYVLRQKLVFDYDNPLSGDSCGAAFTKSSLAMGVSFTIREWHVVRINVDFYKKGVVSPIRTDAGVGLDSTEEEVKQAYGNRVVVQPHPNDPSWHYLVIDNPDHSRALILETNGKKVISMRAGDYPDIVQPNPCL